MPKTKIQKQEMVTFYKEKLQNAFGVYFLHAKGISANDAIDLKKSLYDLDASYNIVKNNLFGIALKDEGLDKPEGFTDGQYAVVFTNEDNITEAAKVIYQYMKDKKKQNPEIQITGGILDKKVLSGEQVVELAQLPSRDEMLAKVVGTLNAPISGFVIALSGNIRNFVNVLNAIKDQKTQ